MVNIPSDAGISSRRSNEPFSTEHPVSPPSQNTTQTANEQMTQAARKNALSAPQQKSSETLKNQHVITSGSKHTPVEDKIQQISKQHLHPKDENILRAEIKKEGDTVTFSKEKKWNAVEKAFKNFKETIVKSLTFKMSKEFFPTYFKNEKNKALQRKYQNYEKTLSHLEEKEESLAKSIDDTKWKIVALSKKSDSQSKTKMRALNDQLKNLKKNLEKNQRKITDIKVRLYSSKEIQEEIETIREEIKDNTSIDPNSTHELQEEIKDFEKLQSIRKNIPEKTIEKIDLDRERLATFESLNEKGELTRQRLVNIGGERMHLTTSDGAKLDGVFLDASTFRQKLHDQGGQLITLQQQSGPPLKGIALDWNTWIDAKDDKHILSILMDLNAISGDDQHIAGWTPVLYRPKDGSPLKIVLVPTESLPNNANDEGWVTKRQFPTTFHYEISASKVINTRVEEIETKTTGGTVILSCGNDGVYEQYKDEAVVFLFQGVNNS